MHDKLFILCHIDKMNKPNWKSNAFVWTELGSVTDMINS